ncbi:hypothetical protein [Flavobacterium johnsoniae]|uniref:Uncharacterized protein n=1 Tax=Flavobacterium johnsoniae (strain ATCC 17061 / DSM 2064 / JCM 8514 / BCRC 14874 / CCUG 350202 / NBRC 14942 / NCIMB 11054 / UW101) TaxID=376686 RepID=A5FAC2_FLAJ1|nr:hypothetical protein [Flavobacterium johnsoniae]ABQ07843.1 hypothetical protein Fjoh_4844 [Flavobacterium johnsoniae UW101]OXG01922.1 hypothetical protein B0A63_04490 [Flavobacterium johnsoniae UW101]WQG80314.1 hypothetical protein SR927_20110 [Flavobacterium johnsoniae UW101]SHL00155.1 hypothetical protein SAMN05444146_2623 [Flavobacterium johnsoniae]
MRKITQDDIQSDYKEAIREKYRVEKNEGKYSDYLSNPSQAALRDLCWEIFNLEPTVDDLAVYRNFFKADFIPREVDTSQQYTDKFKKVGAFFKAERETAKISTVELAAILVDFQPRPFNKFRKEIDPQNLKLIEELRKNKHYKPEISSNGFIDEVEIKKKTNLKTEETEKEKTYVPLPFIAKDSYGANIKEYEITQTSQSETNPTESNCDETDKSKAQESKPKREKLFRRIRQILFENFLKRLGKTAAVIILIFCSIGGVVYFAFFKKHCMQWTGDHYEIVDCSSKITPGSCVIIPLDESLLDFRKLNACDTTTCFKKNGEAFVWYGKTANGVDFFNDNGNGRHPETNVSLRPVTNYMFNKYLKGKPCE